MMTRFLAPRAVLSICVIISTNNSDIANNINLLPEQISYLISTIRVRISAWVSYNRPCSRESDNKTTQCLLRNLVTWFKRMVHDIQQICHILLTYLDFASMLISPLLICSAWHSRYSLFPRSEYRWQTIYYDIISNVLCCVVQIKYTSMYHSLYPFHSEWLDDLSFRVFLCIFRLFAFSFGTCYQA